MAGASLNFALSVGGLMVFLIFMLTELQARMNVVERLSFYINDIPREPKWTTDVAIPAGWPSHGKIEFQNVSMKYRPGLQHVLKQMSCVINPGEKIGIAGRTGSGKSTMMLMLLRMYEVDKVDDGKILIDGLDISTLGLHQLRKAISIIPQDPVVFSGTMRYNLDPFNQYTDAEVWEALEHAQLKDYVLAQFKHQQEEKIAKASPAEAEGSASGAQGSALNYEIMEYGRNLSAGQRQLVCIARSILKKPKILLLDEATSSIDQNTDRQIQQIIRRVFKDCTVLTIAHRLNTIMDADRVIIMDAGRLAESGAPQELIQRGGHFASMLRTMGGGTQDSSHE